MFRSSTKTRSVLAASAATAALVGVPAQPAAAADPTLRVVVRPFRVCGLSAHCEYITVAFECDATFSTVPAPSAEVLAHTALITAVECYAEGPGVAPGMAMTQTPGPRAQSGGYGQGLGSVKICVAAKATYLYHSDPTDIRGVVVPPSCDYYS